MNNSVVFVHVGLPKTGSTTLQYALFKPHPRILAVSRVFCGGDPRYERHAKYVIQAVLATRKRRRLHRARQIIDELRSVADSQRRRLVFSREGFTSRRGPVMPTERPARLRRAFGPAHILMVWRHPLSILYSEYHERVLKGTRSDKDRIYSAPTYREYIEDALHRKDQPDSAMWAISWGHHYCAYAAQFGEQNTTVRFFEDFSANTSKFMDDVASLIGVPQGISCDESLARNVADKNPDIRYAKALRPSLAVADLPDALTNAIFDHATASAQLLPGDLLDQVHWRSYLDRSS